MTSIAAAPRVSPELRATAFHLSFLMSAAAGTVYAGVWLQLQQGMSVIALVAFGWLVSVMAAKAYLGAAAFAALGGVLVWISLRLQRPRSS